MTGGWRLNRKRIVWIALIIAAFAAISAARGAPITPKIIGIILLCFACELVDSSLGMGYGTALTPILLAMGYSPLQLVPSVLFSELMSGFAASYFHHDSGNVDFSRRTRDLKVASLLAAGSVLGVGVGVSLAVRVPADMLKIIIGVIITGAGAAIWVLHARTFAYRTWKMVALAATASFNKALSGGGYGPLMTSGQVLSGIEGKASVGITSFAEAFTCLIGVILFLAKGKRFDYDLLVPMVTGALLSVPLSTEFVRHIDELKLKRLIAVVTVLLGLFTLYKVLA